MGDSDNNHMEIGDDQTLVESTQEKLGAQYRHEGTVEGLGYTIAIANNPQKVRQGWFQMDSGKRFSAGCFSDMVWEVLKEAFSRGGRFVLYSDYADMTTDPLWYINPTCIMAVNKKL